MSKTAPPPTATIVTFMDPRGYALENLVRKTPYCNENAVHVLRYRVSVEVIHEPLEVIHERLEELWATCDNYHRYGILEKTAQQFNYTFKSKFGEGSKK